MQISFQCISVAYFLEVEPSARGAQVDETISNVKWALLGNDRLRSDYYHFEGHFRRHTEREIQGHPGHKIPPTPQQLLDDNVHLI